MKRVVITRPEPGASETAARLAALGFEPVILPLTEIRPVPSEIRPDPGIFDAVALTSANAARHASPALIAGFVDKPAFAVGARTAQAARQAGLLVVDQEAGDAESLAQRVIASLPEKSHVLILCGRVRRSVLEALLLAVGFQVAMVETYDTLALEPSDEAVMATLGNRPVDAVLLHSANGAAQFRRLAMRPEMDALVTEAAIICLSERVAAELTGAMPKHVEIAGEPTEESLLAALKACV